jgi:hypothetical protein
MQVVLVEPDILGHSLVIPMQVVAAAHILHPILDSRVPAVLVAAVQAEVVLE